MKIKNLHLSLLAITTFFLQFLTQNAQSQVSFAPLVSFTVGNGPTSIASADFNEDGKVDLAVVDGGNNVFVKLGNGTGGFGPLTNFAVGNYPQIAITDDFNEDGKADLALIGNDMSVLLGNGAGSFGIAISSVLTGGGGGSAISADFNGDGNADLAMTFSSNWYNNVLVKLGNGAGGFDTTDYYASTFSPYSITSADFNGDGKIDLATAESFNAAAILIGHGTGSFDTATYFNTDASPYSIASADFNGDGKADLVTANNNSDNVSILLGDGMGGFGINTDFAVGAYPRSVVSDDFNGDGKADLAVANIDSNNVSILLGDGAGSFGNAINFDAGTEPQPLITADFNADGKPDLASVNYPTNKVSVLLNLPCTPPICLVTVDSTLTHNIVVWEKTNLYMAPLDSFVVYREITTNNYQRIGAVLRDSLSIFDDLAANPSATGYRYKLKNKSFQGIESLFSEYHNTVYLTNTGANFSWTPYQVQNNITPVAAYYIYRDDNSTGNFQTIGNTTGNQLGYTDVNFASYPNASYYVEAVMTDGSCNPTRSSYTGSRSNVKHFGAAGVQELNNHAVVNIYPNPAGNTLNITGISGKTTVLLYDVIGKLVLEKEVENNTILNTSHLVDGIYTLLTESKMGRSFNKVVISK